MEEGLRAILYKRQDELQHTIENVVMSRKSFKSESFSFYRQLLSKVEMILSDQKEDGKDWYALYELKYYRSIASLFNSFLGTCEILHSYDLACITTRSVADRLGVVSLIFRGMNHDENQLRLALFALDSIDSILKLQNNRDENSVISLFSSDDFETERTLELCKWKDSLTGIVDELAPKICASNIESIVRNRNWRCRPDKIKGKKDSYSWNDMYKMIPHGKISGIENYISNLSQSVHGQFGTVFKLDEASEESYYTPIIFALDLLIRFTLILKERYCKQIGSPEI